METKTREVRLRVIANIHVSPPAVTLPPGDYDGYIDEVQAVGNSPRAVLAMIFLGESQITSLGLTEQARPVKFEVLKHIKSGDVHIRED